MVDKKQDNLYENLNEEKLLIKLYGITSKVAASANVKQTMRTVLEDIRKLTGFSRVFLYMENNKDVIDAVMAVGRHSLVAKSFSWHRKTMGAISYVFDTGNSIVRKGLDDERVKKYYPKKQDDKDILFSVFKLAKFDMGDVAYVPIFHHNKVVGVISGDKLGKPITKNETHILETFANQAGWALERAKLNEELNKKNKQLKEKSKSLQKANHQLQDFLNLLEEKVEDRTKELKKKNLALQKALKDLKETQDQLIHSAKLASIGELTAGIAHEIKNPLTGIIGFVTLLKDIKFNKEDQTIVDGLDTSVDHLRKVVMNLLSFSKKSEVNYIPLEINEVVGNTLALVNHQIQGVGIQINTSLKPNLGVINGDLSQLTQVLTNIIMNGADAMSNGGEITIKSYKKIINSIKFVALDINDTGCGMSKKIMEKIFDSFYTTKGLEKGTGLGLSVSKGIIENHEGEITVKSKQGKGTTFTIVLPILEGAK